MFTRSNLIPWHPLAVPPCGPGHQPSLIPSHDQPRPVEMWPLSNRTALQVVWAEGYHIGPWLPGAQNFAWPAWPSKMCAKRLLPGLALQALAASGLLHMCREVAGCGWIWEWPNCLQEGWPGGGWVFQYCLTVAAACARSCMNSWHFRKCLFHGNKGLYIKAKPFEPSKRQLPNN